MITSQLLLSVNDMVKLKIKDDYSIHKLVYSLFADIRHGATSSSGILYADKGMQKGQRQILMLSNREPAQIEYGTLESKRIPEGFLNYQQYNFEIFINPVRRENASRKIVPIKTADGILDWFAAKSPAWGFAVNQESLQLLENDVLEFNKKEQPVTIARARISGSLNVLDQEKLRHSFQLGIGRAKAFGCGFLQIIPIV